MIIVCTLAEQRDLQGSMTHWGIIMGDHSALLTVTMMITTVWAVQHIMVEDGGLVPVITVSLLVNILQENLMKTSTGVMGVELLHLITAHMRRWRFDASLAKGAGNKCTKRTSLCVLWDSGSEAVLALQWHSIHALVTVCGHLLYHYTCVFRVLAYTILVFLTTVVAT